MAQGQDIDDVLRSNIMQADPATDRKTRDKAKKVRETFLQYRKQIQTTLRTLASNESVNDTRLTEVESTLTQLLISLDRMSENRLDEGKIAGLQRQLNDVGRQLWNVVDNAADQSPSAQQLRERQQLILEDDKKQNQRFAELAEAIGQPIDQFIKANGALVSTLSGNGFKAALGSWLGPAAPLMFVMNDLLKVDKAALGTAKLAARTGAKLAKGTMNLARKAVTSGSSWAGSLLTAFQERWRGEDQGGQRRDGASRRFMLKQLENMRDMRNKLGAIARTAGGFMFNLLMAMGGMLGKLTKGIAGMLGFALSPVKSLVALIAGKLAAGASSIFERFKDKLFPPERDSRGRPLPRRGSNGRFGPRGSGNRPAPRWLTKILGRNFANKIMGSGPQIGRGMGYAAKGLGAAGGAYGVFDGLSGLASERYQGKGFFDNQGGGIMDSRAGGYGKAMMGGAAIGMIAGPIGAAVGAAVGGLVAAIVDNRKAIGKFIDDLGTTLKDFAGMVLGKVTGAATVAATKAKEVKKMTVDAASAAVDWVIGKISKRHESGKGGAGTISTGKGDHGGVSYGTYQMSSSKGVVQAFVKKHYPQQFAGLKPATPAFDSKWREMAKEKSFADAQHSFTHNRYYGHQMALLNKRGIDLTSRGQAIQEMVWSTSNQFGQDTDLIARALVGRNVKQMSDADIITAVQDYKLNHNSKLFKSSPKLQPGTAKRAMAEKADLLKMASATAVAQRPIDAAAIPRPASAVQQAAPVQAAAAPKVTAGPAAPSSKATLASVPFMPDDNSLLTINIHGLIG